MAVKQRGRKRTRRYYERTYAEIGLEAVKCLLCGGWFGVKANIFNLNLLCPTCKKKIEPDKCNSCKLELTPACPIRTGAGCDLYEKKVELQK